jgi:hypothetical protein
LLKTGPNDTRVAVLERVGAAPSRLLGQWVGLQGGGAEPWATLLGAGLDEEGEEGAVEAALGLGFVQEGPGRRGGLPRQ